MAVGVFCSQEASMAGRVLSAANESKLRAALEALGAVLAGLAEDKEADDKKPADKKKETATNQPAFNLSEARNVGEWLEARLHLMFTEIADGMFGDGRLTRDERISLSSAIGDALDAFRGGVESAAPGLYKRDPYSQPEGAGAGMMEAAIDGEFVPLTEASAVRADGTALIKIIAPGWGSSGYYPAEVLKRDGPNIFRAGLKGWWDHPTATEEAERPEGSLVNLASELMGNARWQDGGPAGPGLYAETKVFNPYRAAVNELANSIGVSIRARGTTKQGEAEGRKGPIIQQLIDARSVDWVTTPGAGGKVIEMFEAARKGVAASDSVHKEIATVDEKQFKEAQDKLTEAQGQIAKLQADNARMNEGLILRDAREAVNEALRRVDVPDVTRERLQTQLSANPPVKEGALDHTALAARIVEAVKAEQEYLQRAAGYGSGRIQGMGDSSAQGQAPADLSAKMKEAFADLGYSESEALVAANGRR
jgi:hypothetical protein